MAQVDKEGLEGLSGDPATSRNQHRKKKKKVRFRITFRNGKPVNIPVEPTPEKPPKKEKKPKVKKRLSDGSKKKLPVPLIAGIAGGLLIVAAILFFVLPGPESPESMLEKAAVFMQKEEYAEAAARYDQVTALEGDVLPEHLVTAYLGLADAGIALENIPNAITALQAGWDRTGDIRLKQRLDNLEVQPPVLSKDPIVWRDPAFEQMIRMALEKPVEPIYPIDLWGVTQIKILADTHAAINQTLTSENAMGYYVVDKILYNRRGQITSLADVVNFPNLERLVVAYNHIESLAGVESLQYLELLGIYCNDITDISAVSTLTTLKYLFLYGNAISDITPLKSLTSMIELWLLSNEITDLSPIAGMTELRELFVNDNAIRDISALGGLQSLRYLYADNNEISDIGVVSELSSLVNVSFEGNPVADTGPAESVNENNPPIPSGELP